MQEHTDIAKPELAPVPIWRCKSPDCKAWMRDELIAPEKPKRGAKAKGAARGAPKSAAAPVATGGAPAPSAAPSCPLCQGAMIRGMKHLPKLVKKAKSPKKPPEEQAWLH
ncbi:cold-inducible protein YdjO-related protein [Paenibacillus sp.]|uniref:cold-inducible protein YdjO-related protein n=1 Tax=Paenibacillus sp. TaxID=58172 RepID=UPI002D5A1FCC|nr:cold-inducible protein YdjO-related protein [Paenibacillus sp.]HZG57662.1 cold-inducible protein YdjO-related protein [Paenibacillus sp.]